MGFESFVGNSKIIERLRTKLREGRFPHGLIFAGPAGAGKHTCALMVAKALNCTVSGSDNFCDHCSSCRKTDAGTHPDVLRIALEEDATQIKIGQIRAALSVLEFQPLEGRNKIFIIDPSNLMNPEASNALLKGLEEPPQNSFFILIAVNVHELLFTVRSRCQTYNFAPLTLEEIRRHGITEELVTRWSQGSIGVARSLNLEDLKARRDAILDFIEVAATAQEEDFRHMLAGGADLARSRQEFTNDLPALTVLLADLLYLAEGMPEKIVNVDAEARLQKLASIIPTERLVRMADFLRVIESGLKSNANRQMMLDVMSLVINGKL